MVCVLSLERYCIINKVYPDPVRVVSVGIDVDAMLANPSNPEWSKTSIEFCGGTHVKQTGDIKRFVILEDVALAKGVRRIVAVTGEEALVAQRAAAEFVERLDQLEKLDGSDFETTLKRVGKELDAATLPTVLKSELRDRFAGIKKVFDDREKTRKNVEMKEAVEYVKGVFEGDVKVFVGVVNRTGNSKALSQAIGYVKGMGNCAAMLISVDEENQKVGYQCVVPREMNEKGFKATEWARVVCDVVGGKNGGNDLSAQGSGVVVGGVDEAVRLANDFAKKMSL